MAEAINRAIMADMAAEAMDRARRTVKHGEWAADCLQLTTSCAIGSGTGTGTGISSINNFPGNTIEWH